MNIKTVSGGYIRLASNIIRNAERDIVFGRDIEDALSFLCSEFAAALRMYIDEAKALRLDKCDPTH